jgi:hypothetical protein
VRSWGFSQLYLSGSSALEASWEARLLSGLCVAPLRLGGLRGKQSTPSVWLGGTGVVLYGRHEAGAARSVDVIAVGYKAKVWLLYFGRIGCIMAYVGIRIWVVFGCNGSFISVPRRLKPCYGYRLILRKLLLLVGWITEIL